MFLFQVNLVHYPQSKKNSVYISWGLKETSICWWVVGLFYLIIFFHIWFYFTVIIRTAVWTGAHQHVISPAEISMAPVASEPAPVTGERPVRDSQDDQRRVNGSNYSSDDCRDRLWLRSGFQHWPSRRCSTLITPPCQSKWKATSPSSPPLRSVLL